MNALFPYTKILAGALIIIVGFHFHLIGQLISFLNWDLAIRLGLREKDAPTEIKVYKHAIAMADVAIGRTQGVTGIGPI